MWGGRGQVSQQSHRDGGGDECVAVVGGADGLHEQRRAGVFEDEAGGATAQRPVNVFIEVECGPVFARAAQP